MFTVEFKALPEQKEAEGPNTASQEEGGVWSQVVGEKRKKKMCRRRKKEEEEGVCRGDALGEKAAASGTNEKLRFHTPSTPHPRPQDVYHIVVDNTNEPFKHVLLEKSPDDDRPIHPLEKLHVEQLFDRRVPESLPLEPPALSDTPFTFVEDRKTLNKLVRKLKNATEFAVNMEHNHHRSFQGLTCLMQISTRTEDFIVDTLKLRNYLGERLREVFQDPTKKKVMHEAGRGIIWLQRDFGIYICNLFDIGQASRILQMGCVSLKHLLLYFCGATAKKRCQHADWRRRPLPYEMTKYAREGTHYLLYIYDLMRLRLMNESSGENDLLLEVCKCSNEICLQLYEKELLTDKSYLYIHGLKENELSARQLAVLAGLYQWRDSVARAEDESTAYILPNWTLLEIAKQIPVTVRRLKRTVESTNKFLAHHLGHVITIIRNAVANSDAFENIAEQLKKERLEELMVADAKSSSEYTETNTTVDADNNASNSHSSDEPAVVPGFSSEQGHVPKAPFFTLTVDQSLDCSAICGTLKKVLKWMGFDQLTVLIKYSIIPFMKSCPEELWPKLVDEVLDPVFDYFHFKLYKSWCAFLHDGSVKVPDKIAGISLLKEEADKLGSSLIIQLTRAASELLAAIASPELNGSSEFVCSRSLVRYVLDRDVLSFQVLSLIDYIFGAWKDDEANMTSVPFCYKIIQVATATRLDDVTSFVKDSMIPHLIQCLAYKSSFDSTQLGDLSHLCREAFCCVQNSNQDLACEEKYKVFESWLKEQMSVVRCRNTPLHELEEFVWIWEAEEEFSEYIPGYIDMLHQVNKMNGCLACDSSSPWVLFDKLEPEFVSKYAIYSASHDYLWAMSAMVTRKMSAMHWQRRNDEMFLFFCELIDFKPYIQHSSYDDSVVDLVEESKVYPALAEFLRADALEVFCEILLLWEPQFHPMIRKGHKHVLTEIVLHLTSLENITFLQPLLPDIRDFPVHLRPYAANYIDSRNKMYNIAKEQARLHEQFDAHLASGVLDRYLCKGDAGSQGDALKAVLNDGRQFSVLDHGLIKLSFERRAELLDRREQLHSYYERFQRVIKDEQLRIGLQSLIDELEGEGFFCIDDDAIDWDKKSYLELMDRFDKQVFARLDLPKYYVIRGIMDYRAMSLMNDGSCSWNDVFEEVVGKPYHRWIQNIPLFWMDTRYYKHQYYDIIQEPLQKKMVRGKRLSSGSASVASSSAATSPMAPPSAPTEGSTAADVIDVDALKDRPAAKRQKRMTSECWDHFTRYEKKEMVNGIEVKEEWAKCNYCKYEAVRNSKNGTSVFLSHIKMHSVKLGQQLLKVEKNGEDAATVDTFRYDQAVSLKKFYMAIIMHEYPFSIVQHYYLRDFILSLRPSFPLRCRNTAREAIKDIFDEEWKTLYEYFKTVKCRFSATMDMWTSNQNKGYMCVTIHWIDDTWSIQKRIIRFMHLEGRHTGSNMANELVSSLIRWFIEKKMFSLSLDNAAANEVCVNSVITQLKNHAPLVCDGSFFHVRCANHILNLVARDGLQQISSGVSNIRTFVLAVKSSPPLFEDFNKCAAECGLKKSAGLPLDVQTRWNSTYKMLREALIYRKAFQRLYELDKRRFEKFLPSAADWENALQLCRCLKKFDDLTVLFSGNSYPTANLFYKGFCEAKVLITEWCTSRNEIIKKMACSMNTKFNKYWDKSNIALAVAFFLDPRYKKNGIEHYMKKVYGELLYPAKVEELMIAVKKMYASYEPARSASQHTSSSTSNVEASDLLEEEEKDEYYESLQGNMVDEDGTTASDLDKYMSEPPTILPNRLAFDKFDVLSWWKTNQEVYPTLCKLARDVLAIQVSTVASESAFSAGGRVIDPYRSRLDPEIVEALICTKDWVAATKKDNKKPGSILKDLDLVETLVTNMNLEDLLEDKAKQRTFGASESDDDGATPAHESHDEGEEDASYDAAMSFA